MELIRSESAPWVPPLFEHLKSFRADESAAVKVRREKAFSAFQECQIPTTHQEEWRYTNLTPVAKTNFSLSELTSSGIGLVSFLDSRCLKTSEVAARIVFVNGRFSGELSSGSKKELEADGVDFSLSAEELPENNREDLQTVFVSLNTALFQEALALKVQKNRVVEKPIEVVFLTIGSENPICSFPRMHLAVDISSKVTVIERHLTTGTRADQVSTFCAAVTDFDIRENGELNHVFIQDLGPGATLIANSGGEIARSARYNSHVIQLGGKLVRSEIRPRFNGPQAECLLSGLTVISESQHVDNYTVLDHASPHCFSRENYKGVYKDRSSGAFCGTIIVRQEAQKTNAIQSNRSLLLSPTAIVDTKPQLKIWADDVKCTHGATVGQLDEDALFYLRARGIPESAARQILVTAFIKEVVEGLPSENIQENVWAAVEQRL